MRVLGVGLITDQLKSGMKTLITPNIENLSFFQRLGCIFKCYALYANKVQIELTKLNNKLASSKLR